MMATQRKAITKKNAPKPTQTLEQKSSDLKGGMEKIVNGENQRYHLK